MRLMQVLYCELPAALKAPIESGMAGGVSRRFSQSSIAFGSVVSLTQSGTGTQTYSPTLSSHSGHCQAALANTHPHTLPRRSCYKHTHGYYQSHCTRSFTRFSCLFLSHAHTYTPSRPGHEFSDPSHLSTCNRAVITT